LRKFIVLLCLLSSAACTKTATVNKQPATNANSAPPRIASTDVVKATPEELTLAKGASGDAVVRLQIQNGYHINANPASFSYLIATQLDVTPTNGVTVDFITYPDPQTRTFAFADGPLKVYEGDTMVKVKLKAGPAAETGKHNLSAKLRVQACDEQVCYAPGTIDVALPVTIR
jgi:DsbC/DsbD-like thiol-disulfide interchange protein